MTTIHAHQSHGLSGNPFKTKPFVLLALVLLLPGAGSGPVLAATLHVDKRHAAGAADGSPGKPYATVQAALDAAATGDTIKVAAGDYDETVTIQDRTLLLYGGFAGGGDFATANPATNVTTLRGTGKDSIVVLTKAGATVIDGFRITGGVGRNGTGGGGGVYISGGTVTLANNTIEDNKTSSEKANGAGIYFNDQQDLKILNNIIRNNHGGHGAGIAGGGEKVLIRGNTVQGNIATGDHGGGMFISSKVSEIDGNFVSGNSATLYGGGIICFGMSGKNHHQAKITNNVVTDNNGFGAIYIDDGAEGLIVNNLVYRNYNGIYVDGPDSIAVIDRCTMTCNGVTSRGPNRTLRYAVGMVVEQTGNSPTYVKVTVKNSIMFGNTGGDFLNLKAPSDTTISYCLTGKPLPATGIKTGLGNLVGDPLFADADKDDYHLKSKVGRWTPKGWVQDTVDSPGIDSGDPAADFALEPAPNGGRVNMGFDANTPQASKGNDGGGAGGGGGAGSTNPRHETVTTRP